MKETFPLSPPVAYHNTWIVVLLLLCAAAFCGVVVYKKYRPVKAPMETEQAPIAQDAPSAPASQSREMNKHMALGYIEQLKQTLKESDGKDLSSIYVTLSFVIRQYVDAAGGTNTIAMSNEEMHKLKVDDLFQKILGECYEAEFSAHHGSKENCAQLLQEAEEFIKR